MTYPKLLILVTVLLFTLIGVFAFMKKGKTASEIAVVQPVASTSVVVQLGSEIREIKPPQISVQPLPPPPEVIVKVEPVIAPTPAPVIPVSSPPVVKMELPEVDRVDMLFNKKGPKFPFIETVAYKSKVPWQKGRPAWLSDYASYYSTSRHFIARSLNGRVDYIKQDLAEGDRFNVFRKDSNIAFNIIVDLSRCRLWLYCNDTDKQIRYLIKTYHVGIGRPDETRTSKMLTPLGIYSLGDKIAIYKPKTLGFYNGKKVEMLRTFGTRWIPFEKEIKGCTEPAKGLGLHGVPWSPSAKGDLTEDLSSIGKYESDGCIRLSTNDIEEIFAIIITKPATIELVNDFSDATLQGTEGL